MTPDEEDPARHRPPPSSGRRWQDILASLHSELAVTAAEEYMHGNRCLRLLHGVPETPEEDNALQHLQAAIEDLPQLLGGNADQLLRVVGTTDTITWWWSSTDDVPAQAIVDNATRLVTLYAMPSWRLSQEPM